MIIRHRTNSKLRVQIVPLSTPPSVQYVKVCSAVDLKTLTVEEVVEICKLASEVADIMREKGFRVIGQ